MYNDTLNGSTEKRSAELPDAVGPIVQLQEKLYVPVKEYPDFNFVGRILGPRGLTAKQLEAETGCKIMVRGKGSMRDKKKVFFKSRDSHDPAVLEVEEEQNRGKPNWEHLNEDLHVLITVEDAQNRAEIKLKRAVEEVKKLLIPATVPAETPGAKIDCIGVPRLIICQQQRGEGRQRRSPCSIPALGNSRVWLVVRGGRAETLMPKEGRDSVSERGLTTSVPYALKRGGKPQVQAQGVRGVAGF
ncbi:PREDICTED: protein quaking-like [Apaloderma vittatum]|uniref:protein quaking-like n=1 Tax=Apaloderma vittatum TaxID=57397 RepID=UPI00052184F7|nr:PREDICTED: protein quaking-like [Apaloderma vittatum]